jgi:tRNA A37 threonylcarbamoyladenosine synthetase subunit TsaC/SUA5/YrdC
MSAAGGLCLRVPILSDEDLWFYSVLRQCETPLPTSSVNFSGENPAQSWAEALRFSELIEQKIHTPDVLQSSHVENQTSEKSASTIIKILSDGNFVVLRQGSLPIKEVLKISHQINSDIQIIVK